MGRVLAIGVVVILLIVGVVAATFPLATAIGLAGVPVEGDAAGTVWNGRVEGASWDGAPLGEVSVRAHALPLLTGTLRAELGVDGPGGTGTALVQRTRRGVLIRRGEGTVNLAALGGQGPFGGPMGGRATVSAADLALTPSGCAGGTLRADTDFLEAAASAYGGQGVPLSGDGTCRDGEIVLPLEGQGPEGSADLLLKVRPRLPSAAYVADLSLRPADPRLGEALEAYGFREGAGGYSMVTRGTF